MREAVAVSCNGSDVVVLSRLGPVERPAVGARGSAVKYGARVAGGKRQTLYIR